jgi:hypothetical protein
MIRGEFLQRLCRLRKMGDFVRHLPKSRTSGAKALMDVALYGTAEAVPFVP